MSLHEDLRTMGQQALAASRCLAAMTSRRKNSVLEAMADQLETQRDEILAANRLDLEAARSSELAGGLLEHLAMTPPRFDATVKSLRNLIGLHDPVGSRISRWIRPNGLMILKVRVPIGVVGIIYESRPKVTAEAAALCVKSGNAVILRGGSEAYQSNRSIVDALQAGGEAKGLPPGAIQIISTTSEEAVRELCRLEEYVDLIIPRGGQTLIRSVIDSARVPVIKHCSGVCHLYVDQDADMDLALSLAENAKCEQPAACNSIETLIVHEAVAETFLQRLIKRLGARGVTFCGDPRACAADAAIAPAKEDDWRTESFDLHLAIRVVSSLGDAIAHVNRHGSHLADSIVTTDAAAQKRFLREVDSAAVFVNASTRFTDGIEFGMGADLGISTDKLHARGPIGIEELTTYKYVIQGKGQIR